MAAINNMIRKYGTMDAVFGQEQYAQIPMAVVGIVMKFFQIVISIVVGMAAGCIPIVGFNMGAGLKGRVRELFTKLLAAQAAVGAVRPDICRVVPTSAYRHIRCGEREQLLHRLCGTRISHLSVYDDICLREQGLLYLPSSNGQGCGIHGAFNDKRDSVRCGLCTFAANVFRA